MHTATVSAKGWVVIPKDLRARLGWRMGTRVQIVEYSRALVLVPLPGDPVEALHGVLAGGPSLTADLLAEHAQERDRQATFELKPVEASPSIHWLWRA